MMKTRGSPSTLLSLVYICCLNPKNYQFVHRKLPFLYNLRVGRRTLSSGFVTQQCQLVSHNSKSNPGAAPPLLLIINSSCSTMSDCQIIHTQMIKSGDYNVGFIGDRLVGLYAKSGNVADALKLFDEIPEKDLVSWNSMIAVFSRRGDVNESFKIFCRMRLEMGIQPNEVTLLSLLPVCADMQAFNEGKCIHNYVVKLGFLSETKVVNSLISMYGKCLSVDSACQLFEDLSFKNLVSWNSMISVHTQNGLMEEATNLFNSMRREGVKPDRATILTLLQASADLAAVKQGKAIHGFVVSSGFSSDVPIVTTLINVYSKSGSLDSSLEVFLEIKYADKIAWTAMVAGYAVHGQGREAIRVFNLMVSHGVNPDHVTFTHLLCACSHSGLIKEGKEYFNIMYKVYGVEPRVDHYSCMVDLLGRSGLLDEARQLIETMPIEPNAGVWGALLGACRVHRNIELGKEIAERLFRLDQSDPRNYIILSNMYSAAGLWRNASNVRALMKERGLRKDPGCSFIEHGGKVYRFVVGDQSHPESEKIYSKLEELITKMQKAGYVFKTEFVLHDVDEEMKEDMVSKHSEKLAIAFGLLVMTNTDLPILITKNLRICGDCHNAAKFISLIEKRRLVIRDSKRFHHFVDGLCSCGDYW